MTSWHLICLLSVKLGIVVLLTVVPTSFMAVDSLDKMRFTFIARYLRISLQGTDTGDRKGDVLPFDLIAQHLTVTVVLSTVVPTSFAAVDSLDRMRFRFIDWHCRISMQGTDTGGRIMHFPYHLIAQH